MSLLVLLCLGCSGRVLTEDLSPPCYAGGKGSLPVLDDDKAAGLAQGKSFASLVSTFNAGKVALAALPAAENAAEPVADVTGVVAAKEDAPVAAVAAKEASPLDTLGQPIVESTPVTDAAVVPETAPAAAVEEEKATGKSPPHSPSVRNSFPSC